MFTKIRSNWQMRKAKVLVASAVCVAGLCIGFGGNAMLCRGTESPNHEYCQNQGASTMCTPLPISCTINGNCSGIQGVSVCDDTHQVQGCQSSFWDDNCSSAPNYQCDMAAIYTGYCVGGVCALRTPFQHLCAYNQVLAQCQTN
jgi:hypothetical protein